MRFAAMKSARGAKRPPLGDTPFVQLWQREIFATHAVGGDDSGRDCERPAQGKSWSGLTRAWLAAVNKQVHKLILRIQELELDGQPRDVPPALAIFLSGIDTYIVGAGPQ